MTTDPASALLGHPVAEPMDPCGEKPDPLQPVCPPDRPIGHTAARRATSGTAPGRTYSQASRLRSAKAGLAVIMTAAAAAASALIFDLREPWDRQSSIPN